MTEVALFTPANGLESRRDIVARTLGEVEYGDLVRYAELEDLLDVNRRTVQNVVGAAKPVLERDYRKVAVAVANQGYRIVQPREHMHVAVGHQRRSTRSIRRALSTIANVDMARLTEGERAAVTVGVTALSLQIDYMRRNDLRAARHEQMIAATAQTANRSVDEIAELRARLARLEGAPKAP